jgi:hypothetical protein
MHLLQQTLLLGLADVIGDVVERWQLLLAYCIVAEIVQRHGGVSGLDL